MQASVQPKYSLNKQMTVGLTWAWGQLEIVLREKGGRCNKSWNKTEEIQPSCCIFIVLHKITQKKNQTNQILWQALSCEWMEPHTPNSVRDRLLFLVDPAVTSWVEKNKDDAGGFRITSGTSPLTCLPITFKDDERTESKWQEKSPLWRPLKTKLKQSLFRKSDYKTLFHTCLSTLMTVITGGGALYQPTVAFCSLWCCILMDLSDHTHQINIFSNLVVHVVLLHTVWHCGFQRKTLIFLWKATRLI